MELFKDLGVIFTKEGTLGKDWSPFMINRFLSFSFDHKVKDVAIRADKYIFWLDKDFIEYIYYTGIPRAPKAPFIKYIKKPGKTTDDLQPLVALIQKYYKWSDQETKRNYPAIIKSIENSDELGELLRFYNADESLYKKYHIDIKKPETKKEVKKQKGLGEFF